MQSPRIKRTHVFEVLLFQLKTIVQNNECARIDSDIFKLDYGKFMTIRKRNQIPYFTKIKMKMARHVRKRSLGSIRRRD